MERKEVIEKLKIDLIDRLDLNIDINEFSDTAPLFSVNSSGDGLGLDSIDVLELVVAVRQGFGVEIDTTTSLDVFANMETLADFVLTETH
jgi:acyl carrier protein